MTQDGDIVRGSIWVRPTGETLESIGKCARRLQERVGGPGVQPHLTLAGGIELPRAQVERRLNALAARLEPFTIRFDRIGFRAEYFRCLFLIVERSPELDAAWRAAHEVFELKAEEPFEPHVSLLYGEFAEATKRNLAADLGSHPPAPFEATALHFVTAGRNVPVAEWRTLYQREFGRGAAAGGRESREPGRQARNAGR